MLNDGLTWRERRKRRAQMSASRELMQAERLRHQASNRVCLVVGVMYMAWWFGLDVGSQLERYEPVSRGAFPMRAFVLLAMSMILAASVWFYDSLTLVKASQAAIVIGGLYLALGLMMHFLLSGAIVALILFIAQSLTCVYFFTQTTTYRRSILEANIQLIVDMADFDFSTPAAQATQPPAYSPEAPSGHVTTAIAADEEPAPDAVDEEAAVAEPPPSYKQAVRIVALNKRREKRRERQGERAEEVPA